MLSVRTLSSSRGRGDAAQADAKSPSGATRPLRFGIVLARDFTLSALATFVDTLRLASDVRDRSRQINCQWRVLNASDRVITSSAGLGIVPTGRLEAPANFDYVVVVGGLLRDDAPLDAAGIDFLRRAADAGVPLIGLCTGTFILGTAGLLQGRRACVSWFHLDEFRERFPEIDVCADRLFIDAGDRLTCSGGISSADLAAHLVEKHIGLPPKIKAMGVLQIDRARAGSEPQARRPVRSEIDDPRLRRAVLIMEQNVEEPLPISVIAERLGLSTRTFERLCLAQTGLTPQQTYLALRLDLARNLVLGSTRSIIDIAVATGFHQHSHFTNRFRQSFGTTPTEMRRKMCASDHVSNDLELEKAATMPCRDPSMSKP